MFDKSIKKLEENKNDILYFEVFFFLAFFVIVVISLYLTEVKIWGDKTEALFDIWFLQHTLSGMILSFLLLTTRITEKYSLFLIIAIVFSWEFIEYFLETDSHDVVMLWMAGVEHPLNRFVVDPLAGILGYNLIRRYPNKIYFCLALNFFFAVLHLFLGDVMAIQQFLY